MATEENKTAVAVEDEPSFGDGSADLGKLTEEQWLAYEKTGELPGSKKSKEPKEEKTSEETTAPPEEGKAAETDDKSSESSPEPNQQERKKPSESEKRIKELLGKVKELEDENGKLKPRANRKPEAKTRLKPTMEDKNADGTPKYPATNAGFEKYTDDVIEWREQERDSKKATERAETEKTERETKIAELRKKQEESWNAQAAESVKKHDDFEAVAYAKDVPLVANSLPDQWLLRSPMGSEMLYWFGQHKAELKRINSLHPDDQLRELVKLEDKLSEPAPNLVTRASKPPSEVGARQSATTDPVKAALDADDYGAYAEAENRRELARRKQSGKG